MTTFDALRPAFRRQGYAVVTGAVTDDELACLRAACDALLAEAPNDGGGKFHDIGRGEARRFLRHRHRDFPLVEAFLLGAAMHDLATAFLGTELVGETPTLFNEAFVVKGAATGASFGWHQDGAYVGFNHKPYLTAWIALDDTTEENGCVYLLPRDLDADERLVPHRWDANGKENVGYDGADPGTAAVVAAGSIVAFSSTTLHRSGANRSGRVRRAYVTQYSAGPIIDPTTGAPKHFATKLAAPSTPATWRGATSDGGP
jgi:ectoine hydroxylase-related dioxygenase (phytanoyl-CoA dioxygenase family)